MKQMPHFCIAVGTVKEQQSFFAALHSSKAIKQNKKAQNLYPILEWIDRKEEGKLRTRFAYRRVICARELVPACFAMRFAFSSFVSFSERARDPFGTKHLPSAAKCATITVSTRTGDGTHAKVNSQGLGWRTRSIWQRFQRRNSAAKPLISRCESRYGYAPQQLVSAPGRTEILGNHTDHNHGRVLAASVTLDTLAAVASNGTNTVHLYSEGFAEPFCVSLDQLAPMKAEEGTTASLIRGVAAFLKEEGVPVAGFDAEVTSTVFRGSGLSSSAAFEVLLCAIFDALWRLAAGSQAPRRAVAKGRKSVFRQAPAA